MRQSTHSGRLRLAEGVGLIASAILLIEVLATRLFSVLFFYHYSFFAISLVMVGLSLGGILASRFEVRTESEESFQRRLSLLALAASAGATLALGVLAMYPAGDRYRSPSLWAVAGLALAFVPSLLSAGAFLACVFARDETIIGQLYAVDFLTAGAAALSAIWVMRTLQGPAALLLPAFLAALAAVIMGRGRPRLAGLALALLQIGAVAAHLGTGAAFLRLRLAEDPSLERWNDHSRVVVYGKTDPPWNGYAVIDKTAGTYIPQVKRRRPGAPIPVEPWWGEPPHYLAYRLGRNLERVAIIGVGGGPDILGALSGGAAHVDGYEVNGILLDLLRSDWAGGNPLSSWPEVSLLHQEARVGIAAARYKYDVIQASLIDTWAATAGGGFVLSENGLYTVEAWRGFLRALTGDGTLTMTRWYVPNTPAEIHRLVALATQSLMEEGFDEPALHVLLASPRTHAAYTTATIVLSRTPIEKRELDLVRHEDLLFLAAPGETPADPMIRKLLDPSQLRQAIAESPYDISPPTDLRPYFFLQARMADVLWRRPEGPSFVIDITFKAVQVMILMAVLSGLFALGVFVLGMRAAPKDSLPSDGAVYRSMAPYFLGIGLGYILIQLGLHQRMILILGHPTLALAVVLTSMLWGTGLGSLLSQRVSRERFLLLWIISVLVLTALVVGLPLLTALESVTSTFFRGFAAGGIIGIVGLALGFAFPFGVRLVAPTGERAVQRVWAINAAATIAGSAIAAVVAMSLGCRYVLALGTLCYAFVAFAGWRTLSLGDPSGAPRPPNPRGTADQEAARRARGYTSVSGW